MVRRRPDAPLNRRTQWLVLLACFTVLAPQLRWLPIEVALFGTCLLLWRALLTWRAGSLPRMPLLLLVAAAAIGLTAIAHGQLFGKLPGLSLLAILLPLKSLEMRSARDARALLLLVSFLLLGQFLHDQSMLAAIATLPGILTLIVASAAVQRPDRPPDQLFAESGRMMLWAVPGMVVLFLLFPRINGPLWGLPLDAYSGLSGLSNSMEPGSIGELILSGEIAFRAAFVETPPPPTLRYWRGPVFDRFDGRRWYAALARPQPQAVESDGSRAWRYTMTLEAHNLTWMLAMDFPNAAPDNAQLQGDYSLIANAPVRARRRYELAAYPQARIGVQESPHVLDAALRLPDGFNPRTVTLGRELAARHAQPEARITAAVEALRKARLTYTLTPPRYGRDGADEFLFSGRKGFCEHFASAFAILLRAAGIPTRVVTGYQGGELNPIDGTLVIRQSDAHAWVEAWIAQLGWTRIDPTALSAPARIDSGLAQALPAGSALPLSARVDLAWLAGLRHRWEAANNAWNQWVLGYNPERQAQLLRNLGLDTQWRGLAMMLSVLGGIALLAALFTLRASRRRIDPDAEIWQIFCTRLARRGVPRASWEGPHDYAQRIAQERPEWAEAVCAIATLYIARRYGPRPAAISFSALRAAIDHFPYDLKRCADSVL